MRKSLTLCLAAGTLAATLYYAGAPALAKVGVIPDTALAGPHTPLDEYVQTVDPVYRYEFVQGIENRGVRGSLLRMTSQEWLTDAEVNRTKWEHYLWVYTPADTRHDTGMLFITGGANDGKVPKPSRDFADIARETGSVVTELRMVPNQPLIFKDDSYGPRKEDELISYGWRRYLEGSKDPKWLARLPMTKAAVRAMDTVTAFSASDKGGGVAVNKFVVAGASKRGWTTWTTAATDKRVVGAVPIVIDLLNVEKSFVYHYRKYGFWATAVG
ncbi:MAG: PhoPQ-activated pathogenicity-related family protein, partial [Bryobacterales bacterium]|nr:PhoPQ-activated pathogenicity-related family protein [Bryobacterales bacterium]